MPGRYFNALKIWFQINKQYRNAVNRNWSMLGAHKHIDKEHLDKILYNLVSIKVISENIGMTETEDIFKIMHDVIGMKVNESMFPSVEEFKSTEDVFNSIKEYSRAAATASERHGIQKVEFIEKEDECGLHTSSRNSGVLHAGFYYSPDSLKANFTRLGNQALIDYCKSKNLTINQCGKLVVAKDSDELVFLDELLK